MPTPICFPNRKRIPLKRFLFRKRHTPPPSPHIFYLENGKPHHVFMVENVPTPSMFSSLPQFIVHVSRFFYCFPWQVLLAPSTK